MLFLSVFFVLILGAQSARILGFFPTPSISHQVVFRRLTLELHKRGHEIVIVTTDPVFKKGEAPKNYTEIDVHDISYGAWREGFMKTSKGNTNDLYTQTEIVVKLSSDIFGIQMQTKEVQDLIKDKSKKFDLLLLEACVRPTMVLTQIFDAPGILISSFGGIEFIFRILGVPTHPLLYPLPLHQRLYNLTFWEKIQELYTNYHLEYIFWKGEAHDDELVKNIFGPDAPTVRETHKNVELVLLNAHALWEENRPVPSNVVFVGGLHQKPEKELPKELKDYLDSSKNGVIYISFGTNVSPSLLPPERIQTMVKVVSQLPYDVLWKWDKDVLPGKTDNIRISKWLPQSDLLRHPKIKLFVTQGGIQSTEEAITAGVPLLGMPMLMDQWYNVEKYLRHGIGLRLDLGDVTEESFRSAIKTIVEDDSYRQNIARLRSQVYDLPQTSLERAVWWTEHVLRHGGGKHLKAAGALKTWTEYFELNLIGVVLISLVIIVALMVKLVSKFVSLIKGSFGGKVKKSKAKKH